MVSLIELVSSLKIGPLNPTIATQIQLFTNGLFLQRNQTRDRTQTAQTGRTIDTKLVGLGELDIALSVHMPHDARTLNCDLE